MKDLRLKTKRRQVLRDANIVNGQVSVRFRQPEDYQNQLGNKQIQSN